MSIPPPRGMSEIDYETIEAAVTETVRGRWFLAEFARRNRLAETRQLLEAMARLEAAVASGSPSAPSADPSIRLLVQRIKEIATALGDTAHEMRGAGVEEHFVTQVETQARAVAGMMRTGVAQTASASRPSVEARVDSPRVEPPAPPAVPKQEVRLPRADLPATLAPRPDGAVGRDPRLAAFASLDRLPIEEKLSLFR
ncbi:hypothetical protein RHAL1_02601 [Beijerinckiaceae bacterium RH AL1]|nr:hypothetical protein RHCH11_RHCH11_02546 [Beijerinckiaceae bacterium RH CH11]VVB47111.1 hypothetical protein RHAL8_02542 [Beijerinckiaceae bacterium RH AL8]VVC55679.1 hypothetical protein RHAL1_02601 [Beijerinckiaceae bacterium RH AL1]